MRKSYCDRCNKEIVNWTREKSDLNLFIDKIFIEGHFWWRKIKNPTEEKDFELCEKCSDELMNWLEEYKK